MPQQSDISFAFHGPDGLAADVVSFELTEGLSELFKLDLELSSSDPEWPFQSLLDQQALFSILHDGEVVRRVHGVVSAVTCVGQGFRRGRYRLVMEPLLARAALRADWRIYQHLTLPQVIQEALQRSGITDAELILTKDHATHPFVMQPGESDLDFIHRQAAQAGLYYTFAHSETGHRLMLGDRVYSHGVVEGGAVCFVAQRAGDDDTPCLWSFEYTEQVRTAYVTQRDYSQNHPVYDHESKQRAHGLVHQSPDYEVYRYPGRYPGATDTTGKHYTDTHLMALRADACVMAAEGCDPRLQPGWAFELEGHPRESWNRGYRVRRLVHRGAQITSVEEESADAVEGTYYRYRAELLPDTVEWKPPHRIKP
ncbi:type VI secretion system tip protein TssI/VgrG, partial [Dyella sp. ASV21]|uniref:type VI secretion system Vgr family protein n=1 Tax=Dyella sp. ASV21 TaxID=2795114 RepID=UPI0018EA9ACE